MDNLITEFWKIKRYSVIKAGAAMMFLSVFMSYFYSTEKSTSKSCNRLIFLSTFLFCYLVIFSDVW